MSKNEQLARILTTLIGTPETLSDPEVVLYMKNHAHQRCMWIEATGGIAWCIEISDMGLSADGMPILVIQTGCVQSTLVDLSEIYKDKVISKEAFDKELLTFGEYKVLEMIDGLIDQLINKSNNETSKTRLLP